MTPERVDARLLVPAIVFGLLTWRKNDGSGTPADLPGDAFTTVTCAGDDGREREYHLADDNVQITIRAGRHKGRILDLREVTRRKPASDGATRQARILTTRSRGDLPAAAVTWRMTCRWREENYFRYGRARFALDALDSYATVPEDMSRLVPSPAEKTAAAVASAQNALARPRAARDARLAELKNPPAGHHRGDHQQDAEPAAAARRDRPPQAERRQGPPPGRSRPRSPPGQHNPAMVRLDTQTKLITHAIRMAAFNAETMLARALHGRYARAGDEAAALIREALHASGDIIPGDRVLTVRLDPLSAPRRTRALAALCQQLTETATRYPGTELTLRYEVKDQPGTA